MEPNSQYENILILESQIRECFGRVVWSHKTQEKCADILIKRNNRIKLWQIVLSALTTSSLIAYFIGENQIGVIIGAMIAFILVIINTYVKETDLGEIAQKHSDAANRLWNIRESYFSLLTDIKASSINVSEIRQQRDKLQNELVQIYKGSPRTISKAYKDATKALKVNEELTFSDEEIDNFLPQELRKS